MHTGRPMIKYTRALIRANTHSKPDLEISGRIKKVTNDFFSAFPAIWLSEKSGINYSTIRNMKSRKKISQEAATEFCRIKEVKKAGFSRKMLRPDLRDIDWVCKE